MTLKHLKRHPDMITFGAEECCAMHFAFQREDNSEQIARVRETLPCAYMGEEEELFASTTKLGMLHSKFRGLLLPLSYLAQAEKEYLSQDKNTVLICGHTTQQHIDVLDTFTEKIISREVVQ